jgi:peptidoglycan hydrolase-like protein with peptidoglycan-binding domain
MNMKNKFGWAAGVAAAAALIGGIGLTGVGSVSNAAPAAVTSAAHSAGPAAAATLDDAPITSPATTYITLDMSECGLMYLGTVGSCIISLQTWMDWAVGTKATYIQPDGVYGPQTQALVETFQREYVPSVIPNGMFGDHSRAALKEWFIAGATRKYGSGVPCNPALGWGCDPGAVIPGLGLGTAGTAAATFVCAGAGELPGVYGTFAGVFCGVTLS